MITMRSLFLAAVAAGWIWRYLQRFASALLILRRRFARFRDSLRWSLGRMSYPCLRARSIDLIARFSDPLWQTTSVLPGGFLLRAELSDRILGTRPPVPCGFTDLSTRGSGQYDGLSMCACATAGSTNATAIAQPAILFPPDIG